jgi:hypothetical protein
MGLIRTQVSEELIASIFRVKRTNVTCLKMAFFVVSAVKHSNLASRALVTLTRSISVCNNEVRYDKSIVGL